MIPPVIVKKPNTVMASHFKIPSPWDIRNCPSFDGKSAESLMKYIKFCRMIITSAGLTTDTERKDTLVKYSSIQVQEEWSSLETYKTGTFEEWVAEIESLFPEIETITTGSLARLDKICEDYKGLKKSDKGKVKRFGVSFKNEALKLMKAPSLVTNPDLVDKYIACFEPAFAGEINLMISQTLYWKTQAPKAQGPASGTTPAPSTPQLIRGEDTIELADLIEMVENLTKINTTRTVTMANLTAMTDTHISVGSAVGAGEFIKLKNEVSGRLDSFAGEVAQIKDSVALTEARRVADKKAADTARQEDKNELKESWKQTLNQALQGHRSQPEITLVQPQIQPGPTYRSQGGSSENRDCYYCYLSGHMVRDCPYKREHIDGGKILIENNRMRLGDGSPFPKWPESKSQKQRVDDYYASKVVNGAPQILMQSYQHPRSDQVSQFQACIVDNLSSVYDSRDDEIRTWQAQDYIKDQLRGGQSQFPVATYIQGNHAMSNGGSVQTYAPSQMNFPTIPQQQSPVQPQVPPQIQQQAPQNAPPMALPGNVDWGQLAQFIAAIRGGEQDRLPTTQDQFATTRGNPKGNSSGPANF